jgi:hypothetical protein
MSQPWWRRSGHGKPLPSAAERELERLDAETTAARAAEAQALVAPLERNTPDSLNPDDFQELIDSRPANDETLHVEEPLQEALRDEGPELDGFDPDEVEAELPRLRHRQA